MVMKKRLLSVLLAAVMCIGTLAIGAGASAATAPNILQYSENTASGEFVINSYAGMVAFSALASTTDFAGKTVYLGNDIDMSEGLYTPFASFAGTFDGQGFALKNIRISVSKANAGVFAKTTATAHIKDLGVWGGNITLAADTDSQRVGSIVGNMSGGLVERCYSTATLVGKKYASTSTNDISVGGIVGANLNGGVVKDCYFAGNATGVNHASGISDWAQGHYDGYVGTLINCLNIGTLNAGTCYGLARYSGSILEANKASAVTNSYYVGNYEDLAFTTQDVKIDAYKIGSGNLAYLLNQSGATKVWRQGELFPELGGSGGVYKLTISFVCNGVTTTQTVYMNAGDKYSAKGISATLSSAGNVTNNVFTMPAANASLTVTTSTPNIINYSANNTQTKFVVTNAAGFTQMATLVNGGTTLSGVSIYMLADIDMTSVSNHTPIGTHVSDSDRSKSFQGKLYGNGYKVLNLRVNKTDLNGAGLFGSAYKASFYGVGIYGGYVTSANRPGGIAGYGDSCVFENCYNTASITMLTGADGAGGLTGVSRSTTSFKNCFNYGTVTADKYAGGISGWGQTNVKLVNCFNRGKVAASAGQALSRYNGSLTTLPANCFYIDGENSGYGEGITNERFNSGSIAWLLNTNGGSAANSGVFTSTPAGPALCGENSTPAIKVTVSGADSDGKVLDVKALYCNGGDLIGISGSAANVFANAALQAPATDGAVTATVAPTALKTLAIGTAAQLASFASAVNGGNSYKGYYVYLTADIDMSAASAVSIGTESAPFMGVFDGCGKKISGYNVSASPKNQGLFGYVKGGLVENVFLTGSSLTGGPTSGALIGNNDGGTLINSGSDATVNGFYTEAGRQISVMSFNIRVPNDASPNNLSDRTPRVKSHLTTYSPDIVGFQEVTPAWKTVIDGHLSGYNKEFIWRDSNNAEAAPLYWKSSVFTTLEQGTFWLSSTPDTMSKDWDAGCYRTCSYAALVHKTSGTLVLAFNTHFDHQSETARTNSASLVVERMKALQEKYTALGYGENIATFCTGDYNCKPDTQAYANMIAGFDDMRSVADSLGCSESQITFQGFSDSGGSIIDFIFTDSRGANTVSFKVCAEKVSGGFISDHYTLYGVVGLEAQNLGGLVGKNSGLISDCFTLGTVKKSLNAGGIAGYNEGTVQNSYNGATVQATDYMGGIAGIQSGVVANSYYLASGAYNAFAAQSLANGSKTAAELKTSATAGILGDAWTWREGVNGGYPYPVSLFELTQLVIGAVSDYTRADNALYQIGVKTDISFLLSNFENDNLVVRDATGKELTGTELVGTGATVSVVVGGTVTDSATVIVMGDINGDAMHSTLDYMMLASHVKDISALTGASFLAADIDGDGNGNTVDYIALRTLLVN